MNTEIVTRESGALAIQPSDPESILRFALEKGATVEVIERLMAVRRELQAESAKAMFDAALARFQSRCPIIAKRKFGAKNAYKYAPLDDIIHQTKELIQECGFSYSLTSSVETGGWLLAQCKITHAAGHFEVSEFKVPVDTKNPMMSEPQRYGGAMTFAKRYALCNAFGIVTADEDTDAVRERPEGKSQPQSKVVEDPSPQAHAGPTRDELRKRIWDRAESHFGGDALKFSAWLVEKKMMIASETLARLPDARLLEICEFVEDNLEAKF